MGAQHSQYTPQTTQGTGTATTCACNGSTAFGRLKERACSDFHKATASAMDDTPDEEYRVHDGVRNMLRALMVSGVFAAVIALIVVTYVTDDSVRGSAVIVREDNVDKLSQARIELANCPCQNGTLFWSTFASVRAPLSVESSVRAPLSVDGNKLIELCQHLIVPELATLAAMTANSSQEEIRAYNGHIATLRANVATYIACMMAVGEVVKAMDPNPDLHHIGMGNNLESSELLSERQLRERLDSFIAGRLQLYSVDSALQLTLQFSLLQQQQNKFSTLIADATATGSPNDTTATSTLDAAKLSFAAYTNITQDVLVAALTTGTDLQYLNRVLDAMQGATTIDYAAYQEGCKAFYCDYITIKSSWGRITEFLALLGGLYTTCFAIGFTIWFLMAVVLPDGTAPAPAVPLI